MIKEIELIGFNISYDHINAFMKMMNTINSLKLTFTDENQLISLSKSIKKVSCLEKLKIYKLTITFQSIIKDNIYFDFLLGILSKNQF